MVGFFLVMLLGVWGFEYIGKYLFCILCYDQCYIYMVVIGLGLVSGIGLILCLGLVWFVFYMIFVVVFVLFYFVGFVGWYVGIEYDWWVGLVFCIVGGIGNILAGSIFDVLGFCVIVFMCDEVSWIFFGIFMVGYNVLILFVMVGVFIFVGYCGFKGEVV